MKAPLTIIIILLLSSLGLHAQSVKLATSNLEPVTVMMSVEKLQGKDVVKVVMDSTVQGSNMPSYAKLKGVEFKDGTIEVTLLSRLLKSAGPGARGFIGVAFRISEDNSKFEGIYIRPTNGRADDQVRRNHSIQYFSHPDFHFDRLRKEEPEKYESYADMGLDEWIKLRIEVKGQKARLFINDAKQPSLIVNDMKLGENVSGGVALWVDGGTEGYFGEVRVKKE